MFFMIKDDFFFFFFDKYIKIWEKVSKYSKKS